MRPAIYLGYLAVVIAAGYLLRGVLFGGEAANSVGGLVLFTALIAGFGPLYVLLSRRPRAGKSARGSDARSPRPRP